MVKPDEMESEGTYVSWKGDKGKWSLMLKDAEGRITKITFFPKKDNTWLAVWARKKAEWSSESYMREKMNNPDSKKGKYKLTNNGKTIIWLEDGRMIIFPRGLPNEHARLAIVYSKNSRKN